MPPTILLKQRLGAGVSPNFADLLSQKWKRRNVACAPLWDLVDMGDPLFLNAPAIRRARRHVGVVSLDGMDCLRESGQPPSRAMAAVTAIVCVAISCIWGFIFTSPDMPGINPTIDYAWYIPVSPLFNVVWLASTFGLICAFYLVLRASPSNPARGVAVAAFLAQYLLRVVWAWAFFVQRTPYGSVLSVEFFVLGAVLAAIFAARVDRRAVLFMAPYLSWITFVSFVTASKAFDAAG